MLHRLLILNVAIWLALAPTARAELVPDFLMGTDPAFQDHVVKDFQLDFKGVWLQALQRPEADYQRMAAKTVARAHEYGIPHLEELAPALEKIVAAPSSHPAARYAAAQALIVLDARSSAEKLWDAAQQHGADLRQLIEPAVARWDFPPAHVKWLQRLEEPRTPPRDLILALRCCGIVRDPSALPSVVKIALDIRRTSDVRLEAAQAAGEIADAGLEADAERLGQDQRVSPVINRLCAVRFLERHTSEAARRELVGLGGDEEPSVAAAALKRLNDIDPELVVPLAEAALQNGDPRVREQGARAWIRVPDPGRLVRLAPALEDEHRQVRKLVSDGLYELAQRPEYGELIREEAMKVLSGDSWQGQERAALLLGALEHKPAAKRLVKLLESTRPEVMIHSAWALRKLAEPSTASPIISKIRRQTAERKQQTIPGVDEQVAHLFEACGVMKIEQSEPWMVRYIPKDRTMDASRGAAIWALGHFYAGQAENPVSNALMERILDIERPPESPFVKQMCAVALGRMKAVKHASQLRETFSPKTPASALVRATRWAIQELTGEEFPPEVPIHFPDGNWFLQPLK